MGLCPTFGDFGPAVQCPGLLSIWDTGYMGLCYPLSLFCLMPAWRSQAQKKARRSGQGTYRVYQAGRCSGATPRHLVNLMPANLALSFNTLSAGQK